MIVDIIKSSINEKITMTNIQSVMFGLLLYGCIPFLEPKLKYKMAIMDLLLLILPIALPISAIVGFYLKDLAMGYSMLGGTMGFYLSKFYVKQRNKCN